SYLLCHVERSRDISEYSLLVVRHATTARHCATSGHAPVSRRCDERAIAVKRPQMNERFLGYSRNDRNIRLIAASAILRNQMIDVVAIGFGKRMVFDEQNILRVELRAAGEVERTGNDSVVHK